MKRDKIIYWVFTILLCAIFTFSVFLHLLQTEKVQQMYSSFSFPTWIVIPNGILKVFGIIAILSGQSNFLKEWAYAGLFFAAVMAFSAHQMANDGAYLFSLIAIVSVVVSRYYWGRLYKK